ncbi:MAG: RNA polymerase sigma factor [Candidatus Omnitrophica bacterium]|nr:RNA polymerase sigma factor [Candidatus Omnitrophota bacterium]
MQEIPKPLLNHVAQADIRAFEEIYKLASSFVYSTALRITNNRADAEEVTQDVFIKLYQKLKSFHFRSAFKTWLYRITVNTAINACKRRTPEMKRRADFELALQVEPAQPQSQPWEQKERENLLARMLALLNPEQRACIILREIEGLSYQEISQALKINLNTVRRKF